MKHSSDINIYGCTETKGWDHGSNEGKGKIPLDFCRTVISPGWCFSPPAMWWFSHTHVDLSHSSLLSFLSFLPDPILASPVVALHPPPSSFPGQAPLDIATKLPADWSFRNQEGAREAAVLYPCLCYSFTKQVQAIQSDSFSRESRRWNRYNVRTQHLESKCANNYFC